MGQLKNKMLDTEFSKSLINAEEDNTEQYREDEDRRVQEEHERREDDREESMEPKLTNSFI
jgi:hypothetical protein